MKDRDADTHLMQHLSGEPPRETFRQQVLRDSTNEFIRVWQRRSAWRRAKLATAAVLIIGVAFLGGRLSIPRTLSESVDAMPDGVNVPSELVAWLEAARLFRQLGMEDRMARAVERAGRLLPANTFLADDGTLRVFAAGSVDNQKEHPEPMGILGPNPSADNPDQILAQSFGD